MDILAGKNAHNGLMAIITGQTASENYNYIIDCFGAASTRPGKCWILTRPGATGLIRGAISTLPGAGWGAKGPPGKLPAGLRAHAQRVKNLAYYKDHGEQCRKSIARLTSQLRSVMRMAQTRLPVPAKEGELVPGLVWRALKVNDSRVFFERETVSSPDFTVDLMLDASASRGSISR